MKISREQMEAFSSVAVEDFEDRMLPYLNQHFQEECTHLGEDGVRVLIRRGIERSATYEIVIEWDVCMWIELMLVLGEGFDTDPEMPWVQAILEEQPEDASEKMNRLYSLCERHVGEKETLEQKG